MDEEKESIKVFSDIGSNPVKDAKSEYYLLPPRQQEFYQKLSYAMTVFRLGNRVWWGLAPVHWIFVCHSHAVLWVCPICLFLQVVYLYTNFKELSFRTLGTMFSIIPATTVVVICEMMQNLLWIICYRIKVKNITYMKQYDEFMKWRQEKKVNSFSENVLLAYFSQAIKVLVCMIPAYGRIMKELMDKIHLHNYFDIEDEFIVKKLIQVERHTRWITVCLSSLILFDWLLWIFVPLMNNIKNKELIENRTARMETCVYMWMPFDYGFDYNTWAITHAMNVYLVGTGCCVFALYDSVNFIFIFHFLSHIDILKHKITTYFAKELDESKTKERIVRVIKYHSFILSTFKDMQAAFGMNVSLNYAHNLIVDSLLLYQIMIGDKSNRLTYVIMMQFHMGCLILLSIALEQIRIKTVDLPLILYNVPWENMSTSNQKLLIPILQKMQTPLVFKGSGGLAAGVRPLASILKSTFSYYVMLKSSIE